MAIVSKLPTPLARLWPRFNSLSGRLIAAAAVWTLLALIAGGFVLSGIFRASVEGDFDSRLKFDLDGLIAAAEPDSDGRVALRQRFSDPRFERVYSGWYWQIVPEQPKGDIRISRSLWDKAIRLSDFRMRNNVAWGHGIGPESQPVRVVARRIEFPITATPQKGDVRVYTFLVGGNVSEVEAEVSAFNNMLFWAFAIFGLGLIAAIFLQVRIGLLPLRRLRAGLARVRNGDTQRLEGRYPFEIAPLVEELNSLLAHNAEVVERARTQVSNLAHSLKTPLSVLASEASAQKGPLAPVVMARVGTMRRQIDHYLSRARAAGAASVLGNRTPVKLVLDDLSRTLTRIYAGRDLVIAASCPPELAFRGERQDLEEMAGNLMDNACKWAERRVEARATSRPDGELELCVDDDGPGLEPDERAKVGTRGERLDESVPGSGFGLAIVRDIAGLYGGSLELAESPHRGLRARLILPRAS
ncbi:MAG TPA: ATP-binding protein [Rhizomicrobium sp.]|nr:ATP-binding protein [Rhizomicrobium sp.]